jgi:hypothetical protein
MPRLSLGLGIQNSRKIKSGGAAPSGLQVSATSNVAITNLGTFDNGTYIRIGTGTTILSDWVLSGYAYTKAGVPFNDDGRILLSPNSTIKDSGGAGSNQLGTPYSSWTLIYVSYDGEGDVWNYTTVATNSSTNASYIPTSGWSPTLTILNGSIATDAINFNFQFGGSSGVINKGSNTLWANSFEEGAFSLSWNNLVANQWALDCDGSGTLPAARATSTNGGSSSFIPSTGWSYIIGSGQSIALTAEWQ